MSNKNRYELIYGTMHCTGRKVYSAGFADSRQAAEQWVQDHRLGHGDRLPIPEKDPVRWCPVRHCHMKRQRPWVDFRSMAASGEPVAPDN